MPALVDEIISKTRRNQEGQKSTGMVNPIQVLMDLVKGSIFDGDVALLGDLAKAIMDGDLSQFLADNSIGTDDYAAVEKVIDAITGDGGGGTKWGDIGGALGMLAGGAAAGPIGATAAVTSLVGSNVKDKLGILGGGDDPKASRISPEQATALKAQLAEHASGVSTASEGRIGVPMKTSKEYSSPLALYREMVAKATKENDGTAPPGTPTFEQWLSINGLTSNQVVPSGASVTLGAYKTYVGRAGETLRSIAEKGGYDVAELAKINGVTDLDALVAGAELFLPPPKATSTGGRGEQTMPTDTTTDPSTDPGTADPNNPDTAPPGSVGDVNNTSPLERALMDQGMGQFIYETLRGKDWSPDSIGMIGSRAPQLDALAMMKTLADPMAGQVGYTGSAVGTANSVLDQYLKDGTFNYGDIDSLLQTVAAGSNDSTMDMTPEQLMALIGNLNYGRYSPSAQRVLFGDKASQEMQYKWNSQYNQNPNQSVLEFILSQMGA